MGLETVAIIGLAMAAAGTATSIYGQVQQSEASKKAEDLRHQQMELNHQREQRQIFRDAQRARAVATSNAVSSGAEKSSGIQGGYGQIASDAGARTVASNENLDIGTGLFDANKQLSEGKAISSIGSSVSSLGKDILAVNPELHRIQSNLFDGTGARNEKPFREDDNFPYGGTY